MLFRKRPHVRITGRRKVANAPSEFVYEITPESFSGPWVLPVGTTLEVIYMPKEKKQ